MQLAVIFWTEEGCLKVVSSLKAAASIVCTALLLGNSAQASEIVGLNSGKVLQGSPPFSEAVRVGDTLYMSGQVGLEPSTQKLVPGGIEAEAKQTMANIKASIEASGYEMSDIVKCLVIMADMSELPAFSKIYLSSFEESKYPARSAFAASGLALDARVEVECIASK
ncbi:RidA family protein [Rhizobium sp. BR 315]|uniref:RidA family protein n=1 Tax=Rhizobium sp. BR 315 TaxID=3040014 RepID=UPI003D346527